MGKYPLGGSKVSTSSSGGGSLTDNSVETSHIQPSAVTMEKIADEAVTSDKLADDIAIDGTLTVAGNTTLGTAGTDPQDTTIINGHCRIGSDHEQWSIGNLGLGGTDSDTGVGNNGYAELRHADLTATSHYALSAYNGGVSSTTGAVNIGNAATFLNGPSKTYIRVGNGNRIICHSTGTTFTNGTTASHEALKVIGGGATSTTDVYGSLEVAGNTTLKGSVTFDFDSNVTGSGNNNDTPIVVFEGDESTEQPPGYLGSLFTMRPAVNNATQLLLGSATYQYRHIRSYAATFVDTSINDQLKTRVSSAGLIVHGSNTLEVGGDTALNSDLAVTGNTTLGTDTDNTITFAGIPKLPVFTTIPNTGTLGQMIIYQQNDGTQYLKVWIRTGIGLNSGGGFNSAESWMTVTLT
jgi:hypothetical protein